MPTTAPNAATYLDRAMTALRSLGVSTDRAEPAPVVALIQKVAVIDEPSALMIARTLQQASLFNQVVRDNINGMSVSTRYEAIAEAFGSIRDDARRMVGQLDDGRIDLREKVSNFVGEFLRGSIPDRFNKIKNTYLEVAKDTEAQMRHEGAILEAYKDFRIALKESEILALTMLERAEESLNDKRDAANAAMADLDDAEELTPEQRARLELDRDLAIRAVQDQDKLYQIVKDLADNLKVSYAASEVVMARLAQTSEVKQRVYSQAVVFFSTNETVLTGINAAFVSMLGLNEATKTHEAMKDGVNKGLEVLAELGDAALEEGIRAGYGPNIQVESVKKLVDAIVAFQEKERSLVQEMRALASQASADISATVEDGKRRYARLIEQSASL